MSSEDESEEVEDQEKTNEKEDLPSSRQAKKVARLNQILFENEHKAQISKVSKILKKKDHERTDEDIEVLSQSPEITSRLSKLKERRGALKQRVLEIEDPKAVLERKCKALAEAIRHSNKVVVYTGAGISTAASIPDYRGPNGVWTLLQKGQQPIAQDLCDAKPTLTHMSIKKLQDEGHISHVVSQNCDGLHMRSGLNRRKLSEVHGNMYNEICYNCKPHQEYIRLFDVTERTGVRRHQTDRKCHTCKEPLKDTIVHFGEKGGLKCPYRWKEAAKAADRCDIILCLGTSLKILKKYSCLWCMDRKVKNRPELYIVNLQWTPRDDAATMKINGRCDEVMRMLMKDLKYSIPMYNEEKDPLFILSTPLLEDELETTTKKILEKPKCDRNLTDNVTVKCETKCNRNLTDNIAGKCEEIVEPKKAKCEEIMKSDQIKCENSIVKSERIKCEDNYNNSILKHSTDHTVRTLLENQQLSSQSFYRYNSMWSAPPVYPYSPLGIPLFTPGIPNFRQQVKFGEISFQKYVNNGDCQKKGIHVKKMDAVGKVKSKTNDGNKKCESKQKHDNLVKNEELVRKTKEQNMSVVPHEQKSAASSEKYEGSKIHASSSARTSSGRSRKSFCANCHGLRGKCPCMLLESVKKKKVSVCSVCQQPKQQCECSVNQNLSVCPLCRQVTDKCTCCDKNVSGSVKCEHCCLPTTFCKCSTFNGLSLCQLCRHPPNKCNCVQNSWKDIPFCMKCRQLTNMCKCASNHTSSFTQGANVPNFSGLPSSPLLPFLDYAKYAFSANNFLPFYMPQVFHNDYMNGLLPGNNLNGMLPGTSLNGMLPGNSLNGMLPGNPLNGMLPGNNSNGLLPSNHMLLNSENGLLPRTNTSQMLKIEPILQDHSYLNKDQMQSLSPNCDRKIRRSHQEVKTSLLPLVKDDIKPNLKRSYSYVDDIKCSDEFVSLNKSPKTILIDLGSLEKSEPTDSSRCTESFNPDSETNENTEDKEEAQEKPKLVRSISVPGWFGKGLNLRKRRR